MRKIISVLSVLMMLCGCRHATTVDTDDVTDVAITATDAKYYIDNDVYIGAEICYDLKDNGKMPVADGMSAQTKAKWAAAIYRYFYVTEFIDGEYRCKARSGEELKMSEKVYEMLDANLKGLNKWTKDMKDKGDPEPELTPISGEYLKMMRDFDGERDGM